MISRPSLAAKMATVAMLGASAWLCGPVIAGRTAIAFRDSAHFFPPLWEFCRAEWGAGRVPLWNPYENLGVPLAADGTSSVFYPLKLLWALPVTSDTAFAWYVVVHLLLAGGAMFAAARSLGVSRWGGALAAVAYALSGQVLFQVTNVVFLVGAAWLPAALACGLDIWRRGGPTSMACWSVVLALIVLGGDPQAAYLAVCLTALGGWAVGGKGDRIPWRRGAVLLTGGATLTAVLAAVQWLPSRELYQLSTRAAAGGPHAESIDEFRVEPWRMAELIWPNVGGRMFPENRRWFDALPGAQRVWTPSLYLGLAPLLLAGMAIARLGRPAIWLGFVAAIGAWACWGRPAGLYAALEWMLPGFAGFRYPGKLFLLATLAIALLGGLGFDRLASHPSRGACWGALIVVVLSIGLWGSSFPAAAFKDHFAGSRSILFGPLDLEGALADLRGALLHTALIAAALLVVCLLGRLGQGLIAGPTLLVLTTLELLVAHTWLVPTAVRPALPVESVAAALDRHRPTGPPPRLWRAPLWLPAAWSKTSSLARIAEAWRWDQQTDWPRYPLRERLNTITAPQTMPLADYRAFLQAARPTYLAAEVAPGVGLDALGVELYVAPPRLLAANMPYSNLAGEQRPVAGAATVPLVVEPPNSDATETVVLRRAEPAPRAWIVHRWVAIEPPRKIVDAQLKEAATRALLENGRPRRLFDVAVVEQMLPAPVEPLGDGATSDATRGERCRITRYESQRVEIDAYLASPGMVVLSDQFYPGWQLQVDGQRQEILRVNRVMRGAMLPAGRHTLVYEYRPESFRMGAWFSLMGWSGLILAALWRWRRRQSSR